MITNTKRTLAAKFALEVNDFISKCAQSSDLPDEFVNEAFSLRLKSEPVAKKAYAVLETLDPAYILARKGG